MKKCLLFPYTDEYKWVLKSDIKFNYFDAVQAVIPTGWYKEEDDENNVHDEKKFKGLM